MFDDFDLYESYEEYEDFEFTLTKEDEDELNKLFN